MRCLRIDLHRKFSLYVTGELSPPDLAKKIEDHLLDCGSCRSRITRIRAGHRLAGQMPSFQPRCDRWDNIEAAITTKQLQPQVQQRGAGYGRAGRASQPSFALTVIAMTIAVAALTIALNKQNTGSQPTIDDSFDSSQFHSVAIADIGSNTEPHIVAEGYVSEVRIDDKDGDLTFKLVEDIRRAGPFIVCEIINPKKFKAPAVGSRVRVYGVSRYDAKAEHQWHEVHPVLNIEEVKN